MKNNAVADKKTVIWAACDEMLREGKEPKEITGRKVASRKGVDWSHTTVTPFVTQWHDDRTKTEQDMLSKTQMSSHFVKALKNEVEERVTKLREIDAQQMNVLNIELADMVTTNESLEAEVSRLKAELEDKTAKLTAATTELAQAKSVQEALNNDLKEKTSQWEVKLDKAATEHSTAISELNTQHRVAIEKLNTRLEDKSKDISDLNAKLARAELKAGQHEKLTEDLAKASETVSSLTNENMRLNAELTATNQNVKTLSDSLEDTKVQRDKAQEAVEHTNNKLEKTQQKLNESLVAAAKNVTLKEGKEKEEALDR
ncbi:hypothetical protein ND926_24475 [Vibrio diabolicus]|uniref:hypothetical protein n=1 Tax=Vibrio diabolicus TaxID=50719 RepID=UPI00215F9E91|nr:hypothetical protein [Vibrio diabolicus]MCS0340609.1 hypothetical protein [Vibrio diabolicus]